MPTRPTQSLLGVILGFLCVFALLVKREKEPVVKNSEHLLEQAQKQMREMQARNRARAVEAITQKNNLQALVDQTQKTIDRLTEQAEAFDASKDPKTLRSLLAERDKYQETLIPLQASLASAIDAAEAVKDRMRGEETRIRALTAEAMALQAQERQAQIEMAIAKSKLAMTTNLAMDLFVQARKKIQQTKAQRDLMVQIAQAVEILEAAEAEVAGNKELLHKLTTARDALRNSALNAALWKS